MTRNESRWPQIVFYDDGDLRDLHRREMRLDQKCSELIAERKPPIETWDLGFMQAMEERAGLQPYWDRCTNESDRKIRMDQFLRAIYPIWRPMLGEAADFQDMASLHKADLAIHRKGVRPNRGNVYSAKNLQNV